jgi:hypothetical protein
MPISALVLLMSAALLNHPSARSAPSGGRPFEVTVQYLQRCLLAQGDILFGPSEFQRIAIREMDTSRRILVHRGRYVPDICVLEAVRALKRAGFSDIRLTSAKSK